MKHTEVLWCKWQLQAVHFSDSFWGTGIFCQPLGLMNNERIRTETEEVKTRCATKGTGRHDSLLSETAIW